MIRAVPVVYFIEDGPSHMAFLDTVTDTFLEFNGSQVFESWRELEDCCQSDMWKVPSEKMLDRLRPLCPAWFFDATRGDE